MQQEGSEVEKLMQVHLQSEVALAMVTQTPGQRGARLSQAFPTLLKQSLVWSFRKHRCNTGLEALQYQGVPVWAHGMQLKYEACIANYLPELSQPEGRGLGGNAINCCVAAAITLWTIGNVEFSK
jgi:hypothetical protein